MASPLSRPLLLVAFLSAVAGLLELASCGTNQWWRFSGSGGVFHHVGIWWRCDVDYSGQPMYCGEVQSSASGYHLASFRVARAFSILSVTSAVVTVCCAFIARAKPPPARRPIFIAFLSALVSFLTGLICMASFAGIPRSFYRAGISGTYSLGPGFAVCVVNWVLQLVVTLIISVLYWNPVSASKEAATSDLMPIAPAPTTTTVTAV